MDLQVSGNTASEQEVKKMINELSASEWAEKARYEKDWNLQIEYYSKAIELDPQYTAPYYQRGELFQLLRKYEAAIIDFTKAIELEKLYTPKSNYFHTEYDVYRDWKFSFYYGRGSALHSLGNYKMAISDYNKAIELNPEDPQNYRLRGYFFSELGNHEAALEDYTKAISLNPQFAPDYISRGNSYSELGYYEAAIRDFTKSIWLDPQHAVAYVNRGRIYHLFLNNNKAAVDDYNSYLRINGNKHGKAEYVRQLIRDLGCTPLY